MRQTARNVTHAARREADLLAPLDNSVAGVSAAEFAAPVADVSLTRTCADRAGARESSIS